MAMDVRKKLVELLKSVLPNFRNNMAYWGEKPIYEFADCLLANGVTVQSERMVDAVPVVRCKDCAVPHNKYTGCPKLNGLVTPPDFCCPFGERKDGDGNG